MKHQYTTILLTQVTSRGFTTILFPNDLTAIQPSSSLYDEGLLDWVMESQGCTLYVRT